jgi:HAD superfamily hydrolase (TIGR01459 family)
LLPRINLAKLIRINARRFLRAMKDRRAAIPILAGVREISKGRKAWLCDVWGVLHEGVAAFPRAIEACRTFRRLGGEIILISNSPRPSDAVLEHLAQIGVPRDSFDALVTSGDVTRSLVEAYTGAPVFHLGPERDKVFFEGLDVEFVPAGRASTVVCTGFFDEDRETPEDYDAMLAAFAARRVPMICANPDLYVERGTKLLPCSGLLAERYAALGQTVLQAGKPYAPIYDLAFKKLSKPFARGDLLAIGDGIDTDIKGASEQGIDAIYVASQVHIKDAAGLGAISEAVLGELFASRPFRPSGAMLHLAW